MKKFQKTLSLFLAIIFVMMCVVGCAGNEEETTEGVVETVETDSKFVSDDLPATMDFGGRDVLVQLNLAEGFGNFNQESLSPNAVEAQIYQATQRVNQRLNINIKFVDNKYDWEGRGEFFTKVCYDIMTDLCEYDVIVGNSYIPLYGNANLFCDLAQTEYINLDKPWYNQGMKNLFGEKVYAIQGNGILVDIKKMSCVFFNQAALDEKHIDTNLYELVEKGEWTLEKLETLVKNTYYSADGTDSRTADDSYGVTFGDGNALTPFGTALGVRLYTKQNDGTYKYNAGSSKNIDIMDAAKAFINSNNDVLNCYGNETDDFKITTDGQGGVSRIFADGRALFMFGKFEDAGVLVAQESIDSAQLGLLPYPKYDTDQKDYYTMGNSVSFFMPSCVKDQDCASAFIEAWNSDFYRTVVPKYFESVLQMRYSSDVKMAEMFDFVRSKRTMTFEALFEDPDILAMGNATIKDSLAGKYGLESWNITTKKNKSIAESQINDIMIKYGIIEG